MDLAIGGRVAIVTGGGGGIGRVTGRLLAAEGAKVALVDLNPDAAEEARAEIAAAVPGASLYAAGGDVTTKDGIAGAFAGAAEALGPVDILVNNAGFARDRYLTRMSEDDWDVVHNVVLKGTFHCCRAVLPSMMERQWGRIVNISSMAYIGQKGQTNYSSAKAGLIGMTNALAREAGPFNITCNAVAPGLVATPRVAARADWDKLEARSKSLTPLPRLATPEDIAKAVLFFTSALADFVTAQTMHVSGGR